MSYPLDPVVPDPLRRLLDDEPAGEDDFTILVISVRDDWPHLAMVSRGELVCVRDDVLALALWPTSTSCANLTGSPRATLCAVVDAVSYSLRVRCPRLADIRTEAGGTLACFRLEVEGVSGDKAPYARLESGVRFRLIDPEPTVRRWREVRQELRRAVAA
jgi:hypothetical protein